MTQKFSEGLVIISASGGKITSKQDVFYNPVMKLNRDLSVEFLKIVNQKCKVRNALDLMSASGIRLLRFKKEVSESIECVYNDYDKKSLELAKKNAKSNGVELVFENQDARKFSFDSNFDYVDLDPFGTPSPFTSHAIDLVNNKGFLAVTATDTSALYGTYPSACERKYSSTPIKSSFGHELGLRILAKQVISLGASQNTAMVPVFAHSSNHYMRVYFQKFNKDSLITKLVKDLGYFWYNPKTLERGVYELGDKVDGVVGGRMFLGNMFDNNLMRDWDNPLVNQIREEESLGVIGFYHLPDFGKKLKITLPKNELVLNKLKNNGFKAVNVHYKPQSIKTNASVKEFEKCLKQFYF